MATPTPPTAQAPAKDALAPSSAKLWFQSLRAPFLIVSIIPSTLGVLLAYHQAGVFDGLLAFLTIAGVVCFQLATNMLNDHFDFKSGADGAVRHSNPFAGGSRVLATGRLPLKKHLALALSFLAVGTLFGLLIFFALGGLSTRAGTLLLLIGMVGFGATVFYTGPPLRLAHLGLGEFAVWLSFGPLTLIGAYLVQAKLVSSGSVILSASFGLLVCGILWINEFPDLESDLKTGKRTLMARLGYDKGMEWFQAMIIGAFLLPLAAVGFGKAPPTVLLAMLTAPLAKKVLEAGWAKRAEPNALVPANAGQIQLTLFFGVLLIVGVALAIVLRL